MNSGKKPATVRRYIATIGRAHIGAGLLNPCSGKAVRLALKKARQDRRRADISSTDWSRTDWRCSRCRQHRVHLQTGGAVDRYAGEVRSGGEWALRPGRRGAGSRGTRHRLGGDHAGRRMEIDANAAPICREDQCGKVGNGKCGGGHRSRRAVSDMRAIIVLGCPKRRSTN